MDGNTFFIFMIGIIALIFVIYESICLLIIKRKTAHVLGTAIDVETINTGRGKKKIARFTYKADGKNCTSYNKINVPLYTENGTKLNVTYFSHNPNRLSCHSIKRLVLGIGVAIIVLIVLYIIK